MAKKIDEQEVTSDGPVVRPPPAAVAQTVQPPKARPAPVADGFTAREPDPFRVDVRGEGYQVREGIFRLNRYVNGADYFDSVNRRLIGSIGRNVHDGRIEASLDSRYYGDPNWDCLFLR